MNPILFPDRINWSYQPSTRNFLFLCEFGHSLKDAFISVDEFDDWFGQATGIHRLNGDAGSFFQVIGANDPADFKANLLILSRGIILQSSPLTVAGSSAFKTPETIESIADVDRAKLIAVLSLYDNNAAKNVTHALKAPVNRIKGIAQILRSEFTESPEQELLIKYLSQTSEKLGVIVDHILRDGELYTENVKIDSVVLSALHVAKRINDRPISSNVNVPEVQLSPAYASVLERVIIELLSINQPLFSHGCSLDISVLSTTGITLRINHHFPAGKMELEKGKLIEENSIPAGVNELMLRWEKSTFITATEIDAWSYSFYLPL
ncbi:MAG: signal transduction histidine kinase [Flavobacteriales bacterium]|jgi:signal transduction histidine kinase